MTSKSKYRTNRKNKEPTKSKKKERKEKLVLKKKVENTDFHNSILKKKRIIHKYCVNYNFEGPLKKSSHFESLTVVLRFAFNNCNSQ